MNKILNNEITDSFKETIKNRLNSSFYGTFIIFWLIFHWNFIFTIFFVGEKSIFNKTGLLKNEYLIKTFFDYNNWHFWFWWGVPIIMTFLAIWKFPNWFLLPAFKKDQEYETNKKVLQLSGLKRVESAKTGLEEETVKKITAVAQKVQQEKKIKETDPTVVWEQEFENFKNNRNFNYFEYIIKSIYTKNKTISDNMGFEIPKDILVYADANGLIEIKSFNRIELTEKGRFFVKKYSEMK